MTKLSSVPLTALLCCPNCTCLISYERGKGAIVCQTCGVTVTAPAFRSPGPTALKD